MPIKRIGVSLDREDFMETFIRVLAALLFLAGVAILVIDIDCGVLCTIASIRELAIA